MQLTYDGQLDIAVGTSRMTLTWKNKEMLWSDLLAKVSVTHRTAETYATYLAAKKPRQDEIKDIGGFVGGYLAGGRRKSGSVSHRQLLTLDIDHAAKGSDLWSDFTLLYDCAAAVYSTHKHSADTPRLRLLVPLDREVMVDEYVAIARRIASRLGIENFDMTTYQPERLMYWPSTAKDAEYVFQYQDGPWLSADAILSTYHDWRDSSEWPTSERESGVAQRAIKKQGDPLEKPGIVGAFCRTYSISAVIEKHLSDVYEPCDVDDRYTYREGSTAAGLVVYDDKYAFSHHGTDPTSGKLCNAFDLVRLHKFGLMDEDAREGTASNKLPSFLAMTDYASKDREVVKMITADRFHEVQEDFAGVQADEQGEPVETVEPETEEPANDDWMAEMEVDKKGNFMSTIGNIFLCLKNDPKLKGRIVLNEFEGRLMVVKKLPWRGVTKQTRDFTDDDADCLAHYLEAFKVPFTHVQKALAKIRTEFKMHPVRDYLSGLSWDGVPRADTLFIDYLGAEDNAYTRAVARKWLVAGVARVFEPGIKYDSMPVLLGDEGIGKSTLAKKLAREWFSDCLGDVHSKEAMESIRGVWIMEVAELSSFRNADEEAIKRFMSSPEDVYRPAYGRQLVRFPRQCIFIGTANKRDFLKAGRRNRRYDPIDTFARPASRNIFTDLTDKEVGQLWAEAVHLYRAGEPLHLDESLRQLAADVREKHTETDDRRGMVVKYLDTLLPDGWVEMDMQQRRSYLAGDDILTESGAGINPRTTVCAAEIWCELFGGNSRDMTSQNTKFLHDIMKSLKGWELAKSPGRFKLYGAQRYYKKVTEAGPKSVNAETQNVNARNQVL